jgi:opacity protein-like surface antigen
LWATTNLTTGSSITASNNTTNSGWLLGAGIEWAFAPNWSAKVEYNYLGLDDRTFTVPAGSPFLPGDTFTQSNRNIQMVKVGINQLPLLIGKASAPVNPRQADGEVACRKLMPR